MANTSVVYPNITWPQFAVCNDDPRGAFEDMTRRLFHYEYLKKEKMPHSDHVNPGVEVLPILEPVHADGSPQKRVSFQSKYFEQGSADYSQIQKSAKQAVKHYKGDLDIIYLFCNKTLTTTSAGYKAAKNILSDAGIELRPISNREVLDLVAKYPEIANYFFQPRTVADTSQANALYTGIKIDNVTGSIIISPEVFQQPSIDTRLIKELVSEKVRICKTYVLTLELEALKVELDKLLSYNINYIDGAETLYYYKLLSNLHAGEDITDYLEKSGSKYREEATWLIEFYKNPAELSVEEFNKHTPEIQIFAIDKLFTSQYWNCVVNLYEAAKDNADPIIRTQFELRCGLALFNLHEYGKASETLRSLFERTGSPQVLFYSVFADIQKVNGSYRNGSNGDSASLIKLLKQLDDSKETKQYQQNELIIAALKLESYYHLGLSDKSYLERAIEEYEGYSRNTKENTIAKYYYALCLELNGNKDKAISVYNSLEWKTNETVAARYMIALIQNNDPSAAMATYGNLVSSARSTRTEAIYLLALYNNGDNSYRDALTEAVKTYGKNLDDFLSIAYYVEDQSAVKEIIIPVMKVLIDGTDLKALQFYRKIELLTFFAHCGEIEFLETILESISELSEINSFAVGEIYKALFRVANCEYVTHNKCFQKSDDFEAADRIADRFLKSDIYKKGFLQIKVLCSIAKKMPFSMLKYSKDLFAITQDEATARNIVALLFERNETNPEMYAPYLEALKKSESPDHCLAVASAMLKLGREEAAEFYAYKALYILNGKNDYNIFKSYFSFCNYNMHRYRSDEQIRTVRGNMVVILEESNPTGQPERVKFCLDSESDFSDETNRSLDIEHLTPSNSEYIKLQGSGLRQILKLRGKNYQIVQIIPRSQYSLGYIFCKIRENPEMFEGTVWTISTKNVDEMVEQIKSFTDRTEQTELLLRSYHFEENEIGLPIDSVAFGDYSRYISALKFLLYQPGQALYTGYPVYEDETGQRYVPTLSTLVLLSIIGRLDILNTIKTNLIIPENYRAFFREQYTKAVDLDQASTATLATDNGQLTLQEPDRTIPEIWEAIVEFCEDCETKSITDDERINFKFADKLTGERLISGFRLSPIHLDSLILAAREKATYLCDDLFFRKLASWINVRNLNFVSLLVHYTDWNYTVPIIMELSKTNYLYIPLMARDDEEAREIYQNVLTGEKKQRYYGDVLRTYFEVRKRIIQEHFGTDGDEYVKQLKVELKK